MKKITSPLLLSALASVLILAARPAVAQSTDVPFAIAPDAGPATWSNTDNWTHPFGAFLPDWEFDEIAIIGNGGTAFVDDTPNPHPGQVTINGGSTVEIRSGGTLTVQEGINQFANGVVAVNDGNLIGQPGGTLVTDGLTSGGNGTIDLSGTTNLTVNNEASLGGVTRLVGPDVNFSAGGLTHSGTLQTGVTAAGNSALNVNGAAALGGSLALDFDGVAPAFGDTWDIVDAQSVAGNFAAVSSSAPLGPGLVIDSQIVAGGNGQIAQAIIDSRLMLQVNRRTGQVQIRDVAAAKSTTIDGYLIGSAGGTFNNGAWSPSGLADWVPANGSSTHVGETSLQSNRTVGPGDDVDLGNFYANADRNTTFGAATEDAVFEYHMDGGSTITGLIDYTDAHNNIVLVVDPDTGDTWIQNQSTFDVTIDGYSILSESGALDSTSWQSLASGDASWTEANPASKHIGELNLEGSQTLLGESDAISLGAIFTPGSDRDLDFKFHITPNGVTGVGDDPNGETFDGVVEYDDGVLMFDSPGLTADFNDDGFVDGADQAILNASFDVNDGGDATGDGITDGADQIALQRQYTGPAPGVNAVPEPAAVVLVLIGIALAPLSLRRRG